MYTPGETGATSATGTPLPPKPQAPQNFNGAPTAPSAGAPPAGGTGQGSAMRSPWQPGSLPTSSGLPTPGSVRPINLPGAVNSGQSTATMGSPQILPQIGSTGMRPYTPP